MTENELQEGMRWEEFTGKVEEYQGKKLDTPISYSGKAAVYTNVNAAKASEDWPNDGGVLKMVNNRLLTAEKASAYQGATKSLKEAYEKSDDFKRNGLVKAAMAAGFSQAEAEALAASKLG